MRIAVAGGTGLVGALVVEAAEAAGHTTTVISRSTGCDLMTGAGLADALREATAVIDVSNVTTTSRKKSIEFFTTATNNLLEAEQRADVIHHLALSIVGVDRVNLGYYQGKRQQERLVLAQGSGTIVRATQFHEFAAQLLDRGKGPVVLVPRMRSQPIAAREVANALVRLAKAAPAGLVPELAGPAVLEMTDMVSRLLHRQGSKRIVLRLPIPGAVGKQLAGGGLLPEAPGPSGTETFEQWLAGISAPGSMTR